MVPPFFHTGIQLIHDQQVEEALERYHISAQQETQRRALPQAIHTFLARFTNFSAHKPQAIFPDCDRKAEGTIF